MSPYRPKWRPEAHFELKSGVLTGRSAIWPILSPKLLVTCIILPWGMRRTKPASFKCRLGPQLVFLVLIPVQIKKLDVLHHIFEHFQVDLSAVTLQGPFAPSIKAIRTPKQRIRGELKFSISWAPPLMPEWLLLHKREKRGHHQNSASSAVTHEIVW